VLITLITLEARAAVLNGEVLGFAGSMFWGLCKIPDLNEALWQPAPCGGEHCPQGLLRLLGSLSGRERLSALEIGQSNPSLSRAVGHRATSSWVLSISKETAQPL